MSFFNLAKGKMEEPKRIIALIDMDCFYVQVERQKNPELVDKPLILCQHGSKNGMALSISYEARAFGITRSMKIREAKEKCPSLEVVFVPQMENLDKGDLTCYKEASDSIFDVMLDFCGPNVVVEKASVDEAFLDLSKEIDNIFRDERFQNVLSNPNEKLQEFFPSTYAFFSENDKETEKSKRLDFFKQYIDRCSSNVDNMALLAGSFFLENLRKEIFEKTKYHCSAGIASNKMLAKLIASRHKPKSQTVLPIQEAVNYLDSMPIQSVRWFGGKFGRKIVEELVITNIGEIRKIPIDRLNRIFPDDSLRIINLSKGICNEPVVQRIMPKSLSVAKILYDVEKTQIMVWANGLMAELMKRLENDQEKFSRTAQNLEIGVSFVEGPRIQKSSIIPYYKFEIFQRTIKQLFVKHYGTDDENKWTPGAKYMSINATKFGSLRKNVLTLDSFMKPKLDYDSDEISIIEERPAKRPKNEKLTLKGKKEAKSQPLLDSKQLTLNFGVPARSLKLTDNSIVDLCDSD